MITVSGLKAGYEGEEILHGVDVSLPHGKISVVIGPNGSGKSTLLRTIMRLVPVLSGNIFLDSTPLEQFSRQELARRIAYLPQSRNIPDITVNRMVMHGRFPYLSYPRQYSKEDHRIVRESLETVGLTDLAHAKMETLSGGQRQKAYLAMVLAQDTDVILMDEPTTWLDIRNQLEMMDFVRKLADNGKTVLMVLHDFESVLRIADHVILMESGNIRAAGTAGEVLLSPETGKAFGLKVGFYRTEDGEHCYVKQTERRV